MNPNGIFWSRGICDQQQLINVGGNKTLLSLRTVPLETDNKYHIISFFSGANKQAQTESEAGLTGL